MSTRASGSQKGEKGEAMTLTDQVRSVLEKHTQLTLNKSEGESFYWNCGCGAVVTVDNRINHIMSELSPLLSAAQATPTHCEHGILLGQCCSICGRWTDPTDGLRKYCLKLEQQLAQRDASIRVKELEAQLSQVNTIRRMFKEDFTFAEVAKYLARRKAELESQLACRLAAAEE